MRKRRHLAVIVLAQAGCVLVGLWMEHQFVKSSAERAAMNQAWSDMERAADDSLRRLATITLDSFVPGSAEFERATATLAGRAPSGGGVAVVDHDWRIVFQGREAGAQRPTPIKTEQKIVWKPADEIRSGLQPALRGTFDLTDQTQIAVALALHDGSGQLVVYCPLAGIAPATTEFIGSLPALSAMTFLWTCALLSIVVYLVLARFYDEVDCERKQVSTDALRQTQDLIRTRDAVIFGLAKLADSRDPETGDHLERISIYSTMLASALRRHPSFQHEVTPGFVKLIGISSALHDIGKVGIEDGILRKPARLTPDERVRMQIHATIGGDCLREIEQRLGSSNFLQMAREIAYTHHERWDGSGYPNGLAGRDIPLAARIVAIADVYDALSSKRVYKPALPHAECVAIIGSQAGKHFDPELVEVWLKIESRFREVALQYSDASAESRDAVVDQAPGGPVTDAEGLVCQEKSVARAVVGGEE